MLSFIDLIDLSDMKFPYSKKTDRNELLLDLAIICFDWASCFSL